MESLDKCINCKHSKVVEEAFYDYNHTQVTTVQYQCEFLGVCCSLMRNTDCPYHQQESQ